MIFYVLLGLGVIITLWVTIYWIMEEGWFGLMFGFLALLGSGFVVVIYGAIATQAATANKVELEQTHDLRALGTSESVSGRFYLGSGYIDGHRTLNYIQRVEDYSEVRSARADNSRVYEDAATPTVTEFRWAADYPWLFPGTVSKGSTYSFHIPEGSILEDYTITNE